MIFTQWFARCTLLLCSFCNGNIVYTTQAHFKDNTWIREDTCTFRFTIENVSNPYDIYVLLQYTPDYPYQNLHIQSQLQHGEAQPTSPVLTNYLLFNSKTGKPLGKGWGEKKYVKLPLISNHQFEKPGNYSLSLVQFMRTEQLAGIASVGIQVCKSTPKKN